MLEPGPRRLIILGTAFETRGGIAAVVNVYREQELFRRWSIDYVVTHCDGGAVRKLATAARALLRFIALLAERRHAAVHVHCASRASFWRKAIFMAIAMLAGCPVIFHLHGGGFAQFYEKECGRAGRRVIRFFLDRAACVIVLSERWRAWMAGATDNRRIVCIPNPVPVPEESPALNRRNIVLFLGRIERSKGIFDLLDAISALRVPNPEIRLVCAGDGELESVKQYVERLAIGDAVDFPGWIGAAEKRSLMSRAAVFVLPSYAEGMPMSLLEAMAASVPVIATEVGGIPDVVTDSVTGFLFRPGDTAKLEQLLCRLMYDAGLGERIARAARDVIRRRFSAQQVVAQLEMVYAGLGLADHLRAGAPAGRLRHAA